MKGRGGSGWSGPTERVIKVQMPPGPSKKIIKQSTERELRTIIKGQRVAK